MKFNIKFKYFVNNLLILPLNLLIFQLNKVKYYFVPNAIN